MQKNVQFHGETVKLIHPAWKFGDIGRGFGLQKGRGHSYFVI